MSAIRIAAVVAVFVVLGAPTTTAQPQPQPRPGAGHAVPLYGQLVRLYDAPPDDPYAPGHRGLDVAVPEGTAVRASAPGTVGFAGVVAGNRTVSVDHADGVRTTYSFLGSIAVASGQTVELGTIVGTTGTGHAGSALPPHVHLSARRDGVYFDPVTLYVGDEHGDLVVLVA